MSKAWQSTRTGAAPFSTNERAVLDLIRREGPMARADIARRLDLSTQSLVRIADDLTERGVLAFGPKVARAGPGQPSRPLALVPDAAFTFGVSILSDGVDVVLLDLTGSVRATTRSAIDMSNRAGVIQHVRTLLRRLTARAGIDPARRFGVGIATSGYFIDQSRLNTPREMDAWAFRNLQAECEREFELPVWVENDGNSAAVGESLFGVGRRYRSFAYLYLAAGLGGGIVVDGELVRGARGNAGEFTGILAPEQRASRPTLALLLERLRRHGVAVDGIEDLERAFVIDWPGVAEWMNDTADSLTAIVSAISAVVDPEAIVIGGRAPQALARALAERASFHTVHLRDRDRPVPVVVAAEAGQDAAAKGAAALPLKRIFFL